MLEREKDPNLSRVQYKAFGSTKHRELLLGVGGATTPDYRKVLDLGGFQTRCWRYPRGHILMLVLLNP